MPASARLLLIAQPNSYRIAPYLHAAEQMGLSVLLASRGEHSLVSEVYAGLHLDLEDHESALRVILTAAENTPFAGILGMDDSTVELAALAAQRLNLPHNSPHSVRLSHRKDLARAQLTHSNCPVPWHRLIHLTQPLDAQMAGLPWPCVLKPIHLSASCGVIRANNPPAFHRACTRIGNIIAGNADAFERTHLLVEAYIEGVEVAYEGYLTQGQLNTIALFDKPDPLTGPYFEESIYVTPSRLDMTTQDRIKHSVGQACRAYGLTTGPIHAELRVNDEAAWILEVASRTIGGDCARILDGKNTFALETLSLSLAIGGQGALETYSGSRGVMMMPIREGGLLRRVEGIRQAEKVACIDKVDIIVAEGHELIPLPEGNQYPGYIFAHGKTPEEVTEALRKAFAKLTFVMAPVWKISADL